MKYMFAFIALAMLSCGDSHTEISDGTVGGKVGVVNKVRLFNEFQGKIERENVLKAMENRKRFQVDSLKLLIEQFSRDPVRQTELASEIERIEGGFYTQKKKNISEFDEQIWSQLAVYMSEYCRSNEYQLLLSSGENGSVLFADSTFDITKEVIFYANKKYQGD